MEGRADYPPDLAELLAELRGLRDAAPSERIVAILPRLRSMVRQHMPQKSPLRLRLDSEDLVQEGLMQLVRKLDAFRGSSWGEFLAFVHLILARKTSQQRRRQQPGVGEFAAAADAAAVPSTDPSPSVDVARAEDRRRVIELVRALPDTYRIPLELRLQGLDNEAIAARLGLNVENVRQRLSRGIRTMQERW